jgi:hypothetical protein
MTKIERKMIVKQREWQLDVYSELCPASSATIIGAGIISVSMGAPDSGIICVLAGIAVGIAGPITKTYSERHKFVLDWIHKKIQ